MIVQPTKSRRLEGYDTAWRKEWAQQTNPHFIWMSTAIHFGFWAIETGPIEPNAIALLLDNSNIK